VDFTSPLRALQAWNYDGTFTLEVFSEDHQFLAYSRDVLIRTWNNLKERQPERTLVPAETAI
jgi:hypothetical protein